MESRKSMETMFSVNVYAAMQLSASLFAQKAANASGGGIVLVSSAAALMGGKGIACYSASKGALLSLARSMAIELADRSWRVNAVAPGWVTGEMFDHFQKIAPEEAVQSIVRKHPLGIGEPGDIAAAIAFLLSDHSKWITGAVLAVDGGLTAAM
jgi:NAD(P)-dependent dehydrogenase (short-subunit alcohol dehydrogenase family)